VGAFHSALRCETIGVVDYLVWSQNAFFQQSEFRIQKGRKHNVGR